MIRVGDLPGRGPKGDVQAAREWFAGIFDLGIRLTADGYRTSPRDILNRRFLEPEALCVLDDALAFFREASGAWPEPDFVDDLAAVGRFAVEHAYARCNLVIDRRLPGAAATGYAPIPRRPRPTLVVERAEAFFAVEIKLADDCGPLGQATSLRVMPATLVHGRGPGRVDASRTCMKEERAVTLSSIDEIDDAILEMAGLTRMPRAA